MKIKKGNKTSLFKKIFIKICRLLDYEIIDQSNFYLPVTDQHINDDLSKIGHKSLTMPMGKVKITRPVKSLTIILRTCASVNMLTQSKKRLFVQEKSEYTLRTFNSIVKSINFAKELFKNVKVIRGNEIITGDYGTLDTDSNSYKVKSNNSKKVKVILIRKPKEIFSIK